MRAERACILGPESGILDLSPRAGGEQGQEQQAGAVGRRRNDEIFCSGVLLPLPSAPAAWLSCPCLLLLPSNLYVVSMPNFAATRTSSASDSACILCMTWPRCTLMVFSLVPNRSAICLLSSPPTTAVITSRSRGVSES